MIAVGKKMPDWVKTGVEEYTKRFFNQFTYELIEINLEQRTKNNSISHIVEKEGEHMLSVVESHETVIALDEHGASWTTMKLSEHLQKWHDENLTVTFLIGGPDGLSKACKQRANILLALSDLTLPHPLVRVILVEQLYRAMTILHHHPYHRE
jgi:23S rRNA (pseudouridine1915-N3)-methyltransferase